MSKWVQVQGYDAVVKAISDADKSKRVLVFFTGSKDDNGVSWCPDCNDAWPVVSKLAEDSDTEDVVLIYCDVGDRTTWKDQAHPLRTDANFKLSGIPTMLEYGTPKRLVEADLADASKVALFFED